MVKKLLVIVLDGSQYELEDVRRILNNAFYDTDYQAVITNKQTDIMTADELIEALKRLKNEPNR